MKKSIRKTLSLILAIILCFSLPISVFAETGSEPEDGVTIEKVEIDFSGENVPSVDVIVTPGSSNSGSADASDIVDEAVKNAVDQIQSGLPAEGYVDNGDGTHSVITNKPIYGENGEIIGYNTTTVTLSNTTPNEGVIKTEDTIVNGEDTTRDVTVSMSDTQNNGSGDPADWDMDSVTTNITAGVSKTNDPTTSVNDKYVNEDDDLRAIVGSDYVYTGAWEDLDWENHAFAYIKPLLGSQICVDMITDPTELPFEGPGIYELQNEDGEKFYAYCVDASTRSQVGDSYDMINVEDATYYSADDAAHIRYIAENGYWGTETYEGEVTQGSLQSMKNMMADATNADGTPMFTEEEIAMLTPGLALTVTQAAIWHYGNSGKDTYKVNSDSIIGSGSVFTSSGYNSIKVTNKTDDVLAFEEASGNSVSSAPEQSAVSDDTITMAQKLFEYMLQGKTAPTDDTTAYSAKNAFESTTITVNNQVVDDLNALAENAPKNYNVDVAFTLGVVPGEGDSLVVEVYQQDESGNVVMKDGEPVVLSSVPVVTGETDYTIKGLELPNGSSITLNLNGVNHLESGVYLYSAVSFRESQTMVGYASGDQAVDLSVNLTFNVSDPELTKETTVTTDVYVAPQPPQPPQPIPDIPVPLNDEPDDDGLINILDEDVPLADVPKTGDVSIVFAVMSALSGTGLAALTLTKKKEEK